MGLTVSELAEIGDLLERLEQIEVRESDTRAELARHQAELIAIKSRASELADRIDHRG
jgi:hypothetical protein